MDTIEIELTKALEEPTRPLKERLRNEFRDRVEARPSPETEITIYADVRAGSEREIIQVTKWRAVDLYAYADAPIIDFLNAVGEISSQVNSLQSIKEDDIEFEVMTVKIWQDVRNLSKFASISASHGELISVLYSLTIGENSLLNAAKLRSLRLTIGLIQDNIGLSDEALDKIEDLLESTDFDLNIAMGLAPVGAEKQDSG